VAGQQRVYRQRIRSTQSLKKIFRAMELIAASRIGKARDRVTASTPYSRALTRAVSAVATHSNVSHPLVTERTDTKAIAQAVLLSGLLLVLPLDFSLLSSDKINDCSALTTTGQTTMNIRVSKPTLTS